MDNMAPRFYSAYLGKGSIGLDTEKGFTELKSCKAGKQLFAIKR